MGGLKVVDYFKFDESNNLKQVRLAVNNIACNALKNYRYDTKRNYYDIHDTDEERLTAGPPPGMTREDWEWLVRKYTSDEFKVVSERCSSNRENDVVKHTSRSVTHARVRQIKTLKTGACHRLKLKCTPRFTPVKPMVLLLMKRLRESLVRSNKSQRGKGKAAQARST